MMEGNKHGEPLPLAKRDSIHDHNTLLVLEPKSRRHTNCVQCWGCTTAFLLIVAVLLLVLNFTVFRFRDPVLTLDSVTISGLDRVNNATLWPGSIVTVIADMSIKNPNVGSFKSGNASIVVFYSGVVVGEREHPFGMAKAMRTFRVSVTINFVVDKIFNIPRFESDKKEGFLPMSSLSSVSGKVNMLNVMKRTFEVRLGCTLSYNISSQHTQDKACNGFVEL